MQSQPKAHHVEVDGPVVAVQNFDVGLQGTLARGIAPARAPTASPETGPANNKSTMYDFSVAGQRGRNTCRDFGREGRGRRGGESDLRPKIGPWK